MILCIFLLIPFYCQAFNCPVSNSPNGSLLTINGYGNSTYDHEIDWLILKKLSKNINIKSLSPVLDVGAGFGAFSYNAIKNGVESIYINDLSRENLICANKHIQRNLQAEKVHITLIEGNINQTKALEKIPDNSLGLIHSGNAIHFFTFTDLIDLIQNSHKKLKPEGYLLLTFENRYLSDQINMMERIEKTIKSSKVESENAINEIIAKEYLKTSFGYGGFHCSINSYSKQPAYLRFFGFPCQINRSENPIMEKYQPVENHLLLIPQMLVAMFENNGFSEITMAEFNTEMGAYAMLAKKSKTDLKR